MIWQGITYEWPSAAFLLFAVFLLAWTLIIMEKRFPLSFWIKAILCCLAWICGVLALMQPKGNERYVTSGGGNQAQITSKSPKVILRKKMHDVIFLLDASASMSIADADSGDNREAVAKEIADAVISSLRGENVSLFAFTSATMQIVPSTNDYLFTRLMLQQVQINEGETAGTDIKQALEDVRRRYFSTPTSWPKTLILLTDGGDTRYESLEGEARETALKNIVKPIQDADEQHLHTYIVGIGSKEGKNVPNVSYQGHPVLSKFEEPLLRRLAIASQGEFFISNATTPFQIAQAISAGIAKNDAYEDQTTTASQADTNVRLYDLYFQVPLGITLLALAVFFLLPNTRKRSNNHELNW